MNSKKYILLTIDVEDWFQVENFKSWITFDTWSRYELRVERNVHRLLDLFDSIDLPGCESAGSANNSKAKMTPRATFFVLGWVAERLPRLIQEIHARGHEVASHGFNHLLSNRLAINELRTELNTSKKSLEDMIGAEVCGFRAPSFSVDENVLREACHSGYIYDSSYNSFGIHQRYGRVSMNGHKRMGIAAKFWNSIFELPLSNLRLLGTVIPWSGGAYFRIMPFPLFRKGVQFILNKDGAYVFYLHPWEIDTEQPRLSKASTNFKLRHYSNLSKTHSRLSRLIQSFQHFSFTTCREYIQLMS
jgi:polysaccharide deacetylase family protein (PEP-CTERM system associated)